MGARSDTERDQERHPPTQTRVHTRTRPPCRKWPRPLQAAMCYGASDSEDTTLPPGFVANYAGWRLWKVRLGDGFVDLRRCRRVGVEMRREGRDTDAGCRDEGGGKGTDVCGCGGGESIEGRRLKRQMKDKMAYKQLTNRRRWYLGSQQILGRTVNGEVQLESRDMYAFE